MTMFLACLPRRSIHLLAGLTAAVSLCGGCDRRIETDYQGTFGQIKDDTNATERPVADKPTGIVEQVEADEFKPIDPLDILPEEVHEDQSIETLRDFFPGGQVEEAPARAKKK